MFLIANRVETAISRLWVGKVFLVCCSVSAPVDFALDVRMGFALVDHGIRSAAVLFFFLYLSLRLQLLLFLATSARPLLEAAKQKRWPCHALFVRCLAYVLQWPVLPKFTIRDVAVAWLPLGLQSLHWSRCAQSLVLEVVYAPAVVALGPCIILYGAMLGARDAFEHENFYVLSGKRQIRRIRAVVISAISTSFAAVPQLCIQATVYAVGTIPLTPHQTQLVVCSMAFSVLSLLRSIFTIFAAYNKIVFTFRRVNRDLDETTFNIILQECGDLAKSGDSVRMVWDTNIHVTAHGHKLANLRELSLHVADDDDDDCLVETNAKGSNLDARQVLLSIDEEDDDDYDRIGVDSTQAPAPVARDHVELSISTTPPGSTLLRRTSSIPTESTPPFSPAATPRQRRALSLHENGARLDDDGDDDAAYL